MRILNHHVLTIYCFVLLFFPGCSLFQQTQTVKKQENGIYTLWTPGKALRSQIDLDKGRPHFHHLNQDGKKDMVFIKDVKDRKSQNTQVVKFLLNKGKGRFQVKDTVITPIFIKALTVQDFTNDKQPDLLLGGEDYSYLYHNKGEGHFQIQDTIDLGYESGSRSYLKDLNADEYSDFIKVKNDESFKIYMNDGRGNLSHDRTLNLDYRINRYDFHNINGNTLLLIDGYEHRAMVHRENLPKATIYFYEKVGGDNGISKTMNVEKLIVGSFDEEGKTPDILALNEAFKLYTYKSNGQFNDPETIPFDDSLEVKEVKEGRSDQIKEKFKAVYVRDLDQDQQEEVFILCNKKETPRNENNQVFFLKNKPRGSFQPGKKLLDDPDIGIKKLAFKDMDGDGRKDLCIVGKRKIKCLINAGDGQFKPVKPIDRPNKNQQVFIKDFCCGASPDVILRDSSQWVLYPNKGDGSFRKGRPVMASPFNEEKSFKEVHFADLVGDQKHDDLILVTENKTLNRESSNKHDLYDLHFYLNKGNGSFIKQPNGLSFGKVEWSLKTADLNGDYATDLLIESDEHHSNGTDIYLNRYGGSSGKDKHATANHPPVVMDLTDTINFMPDKPYFVRAGDPDGDPLAMHLVDSPAGANLKDEGSGIAKFQYAPEIWEETATPTSFTLAVKDGRGGKTRKTFTIPALINKKHEDWRFNANGLVKGEAVIKDSMIYFGSMDGYLHALDARSGEELWHFKANEPVVSEPAIANGKVYFGSGSIIKGSIGGRVYALDAQTGKAQWQFKADGPVRANVKVAGDTVYAGSLGGDYYALDASSGNKLWQFCLCYGVMSTTLSPKKDQVYIIYDDPRSRLDLDSAMQSGRCKRKNCYDSIVAKSKRKEQGLLVLNGASGELISHYKSPHRIKFGSKPLPKDGNIILQHGRFSGPSAKQYLKAIDPVTNNTVWKSDNFGVVGEAAKVRNLEHNRDHVYLYSNGRKESKGPGWPIIPELHAIDAETGKTVHTYKLFPEHNEKVREDLMISDLAFHENLIYIIMKKESKGPGGPSDEPNPLYVFDKKQGDFIGQYLKPGRVKIQSFTNPAIHDEEIYFSALSITDYRPLRGTGYIHALPVDLKIADTNHREINCQSSTQVLEAKGTGYRAKKTKHRFAMYFQECKPVKLKMEQPQLGVKVSYEILEGTGNGNCRIRFEYLEKPGKEAYPLKGKALKFTLDPEKPFLKQAKKAIPACLNNEGSGNYDCQLVPKD